MADSMSIKKVTEHFGEHDTRLWRVVQHWVEVAQKDLDFSDVTAIGVDETSKRGHQYVTVFMDLNTKRVLYVTEGKDAKTITRFVEFFKQHSGDPEAVLEISSDISLAFKKDISEHFPNATHVIKLINDAVDSVRRREVKDNPLLKGSRYVWLKNVDNLTEKQQTKLTELNKRHRPTARAYNMRIQLQEIYKRFHKGLARYALKKLIRWMKLSRIPEMKGIAGSIESRLESILAFWDKRRSNAILEGVNSIIQMVQRRARGFRNNEFFKPIIYLVKGGLNIQKYCPYP